MFKCAGSMSRNYMY